MQGPATVIAPANNAKKKSSIFYTQYTPLDGHVQTADHIRIIQPHHLTLSMPASSSKNLLSIISMVVGVLLIILAIVYWRTPADALPMWLPGYLSDSSTIHLKHGIGAFLLGVGAFVLAWFTSGK